MPSGWPAVTLLPVGELALLLFTLTVGGILWAVPRLLRRGRLGRSHADPSHHATPGRQPSRTARGGRLRS